ncbi:MAG: PDC sensor domain-containing protein, partial [Bacteroidales bacterium]|nr:PDC sensor domain-containing protein [Bacteroidales bacterium]
MKSREKIRSDFKKIKDAASEAAMKKKSFWTGLVLIAFAAVFLEAISLLQAHYAKKGVRNEAIARAESQLNSTRNNILNIVNQVESAVRNTVWVAQWCLDVPDSLQNIPKLIVNNNPIVAGSTIALVPGYYKDRPLYAPYSAITNGEIMDKTLATPEYDYPSKEWFTKPIEKEKDYWSEPYIDTGGGEILMTTYSVPIR